MIINVGTPSNHRQVEVTPETVSVADLGLSGRVTLNGIELLNAGQTVRQAITATGAEAPYYFLSIKKQSNGSK